MLSDIALDTLVHPLSSDIVVHVLSLDDPTPWAALHATLSPDERRRAARFHRAVDGRRWADVRGALRHVLGERLGRDPAAIDFAHNAYGKPAIAACPSHADDEPTGLAFNVSHSADRALIAVGCGMAIGVDIERLRHASDPLALAELVLTPAECADLAAMPDDAARQRPFITAWTRKEAVLKALGSGLAHGARRVEVGLADTPVARFDGEPVAGVRLVDLPAPPDYGASLCTVPHDRLVAPIDPRLLPRARA